MNDFLAISITLRLCTVKMGKSYKSRKKATSLDCLNYLKNTVYNDLAASRGRGGTRKMSFSTPVFKTWPLRNYVIIAN